jgi:hypothetical protein
MAILLMISVSHFPTNIMWSFLTFVTENGGWNEMQPKRDKSLLFEVEKYLTNAGFVKQELLVHVNHSAITIVPPPQLIATHDSPASQNCSKL